jgi:type I restriction enzyme S subunit
MSSMRNGLYKKKDFYGEGNQIVKMGELFNDDFITNKHSMDRLELSEKELDKHGLQTGDLLFARRSFVREGSGKCSIVDDLEEPLVPESSIIRARPDQGKVVPHFVYYFFKSEMGTNRVMEIIRQTSVSGIAQSDLKNVDVPTPPMEEQRGIVNQLKLLDKKIQINDRICNQLKEVSEALFKSRFVEFDGYDGNLVYDEDFEKDVPSSWDKKSLDEIADFLNGKAWQDFESENGFNDLPVVKIKELREGINEDSDKVDREESPERYLIDDGDVIFSWSASLVLDLWTDNEAFLNQHLFKVTSEDYPRWFCYEWINYYLNIFRQIAEAKKTTMGHIKRSDLEEAKVLIPSEEDLNKFSAKMEPIFDSIVERRVENRRLENIRDTLLPKLMSGEIRVNDINLDELEVDSEV